MTNDLTPDSVKDSEMKTANDFREAAIKYSLTYWPIRDCSMCKYPLAYMFFTEGHEVLFDAGCDCLTNEYRVHLSSWDVVANQYNMQTNSESIKAINEFWGFDNES